MLPSQLSYESLLNDGVYPALNLRQYVMGFSPKDRILQINLEPGFIAFMASTVLKENANIEKCLVVEMLTPYTTQRVSAFLQSEAKPQVVSEAMDNFRKDDDVRWQWSGATWTTEGCPQGERGGVHQFGVPPKPARRDSANTGPKGIPQVVSAARDNNANFAWVQHFIHHLAPQGMSVTISF